MPLPTPNLDDLRFQRDLVDEARRRIIRYCPEWTDYNLSDPGITLIELFSWMTEQLVYRLNRVPDKNYVKFLELLGIQLRPASSARVPLTFWLSAALPLGPEDQTVAVVHKGQEISTWSTEDVQEIIFTTDEKLTIASPKLAQLRREGDLTRNYLPRLGISDFYAFSRTPKEGDTFYLGFDEEHDVSGYLVRLSFECEAVEGTGIRREDPPLVWEYSLGDGVWQEVKPSERVGEKDTTGGLNNAQGSLVLYLPLAMKLELVHGRNAYWIRCRLEQRHPGQGMYTQSPRIRGIAAHVIGGTTWATHAVSVDQEMLGVSNGDPGLVFQLRHAPVLPLASDETVEVEEIHDGIEVFVPWKRVDGFSESSHYDKHFTLDEATGQVAFGPSVPQPDGTMRQYGRVPEAGRRIRINRYRHGGGTVGNVPAGQLQVLRSAIPYISRVTNLQPASGGLDQETLDELKIRAQREIRSQGRAVTAEDFEHFAQKASRYVARVRCNVTGEGAGPLPPGMVDLLVVPAAFDALRVGDLSKLNLDEGLERTVRTYLDQYRLLTTTLHIREPRYIGVRVRARIVPKEYHAPEMVTANVIASLKRFLTPLAIDTEEDNLKEILGPGWEGWPFGRDLYVSEVYSFVQQIPGVKHVLDVQLEYRPVVPVQESLVEQPPEEEEEAKEEDQVDRYQLALAEENRIAIPADTLICSLDHQVETVYL